MRAHALMKRPAALYRKVSRWIAGRMPKGLFARALIIIIAPMVILQSVLAYAFMERHWQTVTRRLSAAVTQDIAALIDIAESYPQDKDFETLSRIAGDRLNLDVEMLPPGPLPPPGPKPFFEILDSTLSRELRQQVGRPFWIDTVGRSNIVEIRIQLDRGVMRILTRRSQAYASNSHIFLMWMVGTSLVLLGIAVDLPAQPDPADPEAGGGGGSIRQGARNRLPSPRRARSPAGRPRVHRDAPPRGAGLRAAHGHAQRRQPRPAHHPHALQALDRADGRGNARARGRQEGHRRDEPHAGGLSRLRARRCGRAGLPHRHGPAARRTESRCRARRPRDGSDRQRRSRGHRPARCLQALRRQPRGERACATATASPSPPSAIPAG